MKRSWPPGSPRKRRRRPANTAKLEADLKAYEATLPGKLAAWEKAQAGSIVNRWAILEPKSLTATGGATLTKEADGSISVGGNNANGVITIAAETDLTGITGVRLEVLADARYPSKGPGRAPDGNFVLTELQLAAAPKATPNQAKPVGLQNPLADFSQDEFRGRQGRRR